jgi:hypothetical protein
VPSSASTKATLGGTFGSLLAASTIPHDMKIRTGGVCALADFADLVE